MTLSKKAVLAALAGVITAAVCFATIGLRTTRIETLRRRVNQQVAIGASPDDVMRFLDGEHLDHSELTRPQIMLMGGRHYDGVLLVGAIKRGTWQSLLQREDIEMIFVFDENHKLVRTDIFPKYTGL